MESTSITVPEGFKLHTENNAHILLSENDAFLNPIQEFNRDLSVACIRTWSEELNKSKNVKKAQAKEKKALKVKEGSAKKRQRGTVFTRNAKTSDHVNWYSE
jgi:tRNA (guanine26-N2/guanine27-N2)-dimethyltransferase